MAMPRCYILQRADIRVNGKIWAKLDLNPTVWEATAATGAR
jgi:hypothetical protein